MSGRDRRHRRDLLELTASLVDISSVSHNEAQLADHVEGMLAGCPGLELRRIGDNVLARTNLGRSGRLILAGHLDTVPENGNGRARIEGGTCIGLGACDMKGGLAVFLELLATVRAPAVDVTFIAYVCEEVAQRYSGLGEVERQAPGWLAADVAVLGEPSGALVEAGCQGVLQMALTLTGERAHSARPWMGVNAIHRLAEVLCRVAAYEARRPVLDGCEYREALQAVLVEGGVARNVVPDRASAVLNHRFAPDRDAASALGAVRSFLGDALDEARGDRLVAEEQAAPAPPSLDHPLLARLVEATEAPPRAKLGWTDVSFFAARGTPACNFGPGDPTLAHSAAERVSREELERAYAALESLIST
ncbi:MAG: succinyl-diaminopimelate desuccinylase [Acidimicrobiales bacterium]